VATETGAGDQSAPAHLAELDPQRSIYADRNGVIRAWGTASVEAFGYSETEAVGQSLDLIVPKALQPLHWRGFTRAMRTGTLKRPGSTLKVPAVHRDGSLIPVRLADGTPVMDVEGNTAGITLAFVRRDPAWIGAGYRLVVGLLGSIQRMQRVFKPSRSEPR
jgi:PAS domain S-box-containing protein